MDNKNDTNVEKEKCFVIMPISDQGDYPKGHFTKVYEHILKPAIEEAGYEAYRVDENNICDSIIEKIFKALQECPMALCDLSNRNPNVLYELGIRQAYDKPVVLVQDEKTGCIFDVSGINTIRYNSARVYEEVIADRKRITEAIVSTKEGKQKSIIKVVGIRNAKIEKVSVSEEDKMEDLLNSLVEDVKDLKRNMLRSYNKVENCNVSIVDDSYKMMKENKLIDNEFGFALKQGVTNKQISDTFDDIIDEVKCSMNWERQGNFLKVAVQDAAIAEIMWIRRNIISKLS